MQIALAPAGICPPAVAPFRLPYPAAYLTGGHFAGNGVASQQHAGNFTVFTGYFLVKFSNFAS